MEKLDYSWYNISMEERQRLLKQGCINIWIDEIVPCLKDTVTGEMKENEVNEILQTAQRKIFINHNKLIIPIIYFIIIIYFIFPS